MRLFVALDVPDAVRESLLQTRERLQKICPHGKWVRLEGAHVTLKFIGYVSSEGAAAIRAALEPLRARPAFELRFAGTGFFPDARRPRVFWAGIDGGAPLAELASGIETALEPLGIPREERAFQPHLTLARFDSTGGLQPLRAAAAELSAAEFGRMTVREFYLYESVLKRSGAEYTRLATYPFSSEHGS